MVLVASRAGTVTTNAYIPDTSFTCDDVNSDGKIDRVRVTLVLGQYDAANASSRGGVPTAQTKRSSLTVSLPNIK
jgi:hypothetical protein